MNLITFVRGSFGIFLRQKFLGDAIDVKPLFETLFFFSFPPIDVVRNPHLHLVVNRLRVAQTALEYPPVHILFHLGSVIVIYKLLENLPSNYYILSKHVYRALIYVFAVPT